MMNQVKKDRLHGVLLLLAAGVCIMIMVVLDRHQKENFKSGLSAVSIQSQYDLRKVEYRRSYQASVFGFAVTLPSVAVVGADDLHCDVLSAQHGDHAEASKPAPKLAPGLKKAMLDERYGVAEHVEAIGESSCASCTRSANSGDIFCDEHLLVMRE